MSAVTAALRCHPATPTDAVRAIEVRIARSANTLSVSYAIDAARGALSVPAPTPARFRQGLWQHTCCELFLKRTGTDPYHEINLAPSGEWAVYAFARYRRGAALKDARLDPQVRVRDEAGLLELEAFIALALLSEAYAGATLAVAVSAVMEERGGRLSYWALRHASAKPDFHHPEAFRLEVGVG